MTVRASDVAFIGALVSEIPQLLPLLQDHLDEQEGEILPHLFMADLERWAEILVNEGSEEQRCELSRFLNCLELAFETRGEEVQELISASFLEHLPRPEKQGAELRALLGPSLAAELEKLT